MELEVSFTMLLLLSQPLVTPLLLVMAEPVVLMLVVVIQLGSKAETHHFQP